MIKIEIQAQTFDQIKQLVLDLKENFHSSVEQEVISANVEAAGKKKTLTQKKSTPKLSAGEKLLKTKELDEPSVEKPYSKSPDVDRDTVKDYLQKVTTLQGMDVARKLLAKYKAKKISDLKSDQYGPIYLDCKEELSKPETKVY